MYGSEDGLVQVAMELGLIEMARAGNCTKLTPIAKRESLTFDNYVLNSITSETEFAVSNGTPKVLRLPKGEYQYTIRIPSDRVVEGQPDDSDMPRSSGIISWKNRRPAAKIIQW
jgi:hypothetical protein